MKTIFTLIILLISATATMAQNSIDELFETYQGIGDVKFTSAIERNPETHEVVKVVKKIESEAISSNSFIKAFKREASKAQTTNQTERNGEITYVLVFENEKQIRIYSLRYYKDDKLLVNASIIIKYIKH